MRAQGTESKNPGETKEKISLRVKAAEKGFFHIASKSSYGHENQYTKRLNAYKKGEQENGLSL
jgi:hypothetical protein